MKYLELTSKVFEYYIIVMLFVCATLLSVLVYSFDQHNQSSRDLAEQSRNIVEQLVRLELIEE